MISALFIAKMGVVLGTSLVGGKLFGSVMKDGLGKVVATYAGMATGAYIGIRTANNLHHMIENAKETIKEEEESESEVTVNG